MGLDQYAGLRDSNGEVHEEFYWRKHARLQQFFSREFEKQKGESEENSYNLGFNAGEGGVKITEEIVEGVQQRLSKKFLSRWIFLGTTISRRASQRIQGSR